MSIDRNAALEALRHMQDRPIATKTDHHVRILNLAIQAVEMNISGQRKAPVHLKGQTNTGLNTDLIENCNRIPDGLKAGIPIWIWC